MATLEQLASVRAILNRLTQAIHQGAQSSIVLKRNRVTLDEMMRRASEGDDLVLQTLQRAARSVGRFVTQLSLLLNSELVIIAGPLAELTDAFLRPLRDAIASYAPSRHRKLPRIGASQFGAFGGALGAAALAVHQWKPKR